MTRAMPQTMLAHPNREAASIDRFEPPNLRGTFVIPSATAHAGPPNMTAGTTHDGTSQPE
jgi:hypothetical protein